MNKLKLTSKEITFREACDMYIFDCKTRNLREGTLRHYRQTFEWLCKLYADKPISEFTEDTYNLLVVYLRNTCKCDQSVASCLKDYVTLIHFMQEKEYLPYYKMRAIKIDAHHVETYTDEELSLLLAKPKPNCSYIEYEAYVMTNFLFSTGIRQHSLMELQIFDIDFDNKIITCRVTKNRKVLMIPMSNTLSLILKEFLRLRAPKSDDEYLFTNVFGMKLAKSTCYHIIYDYNKRRGVETTGLHRYRHTFAKQWIMHGGNVATLSRLLGHSNLAITQNYINLLVSDLNEAVDQLDILSDFQQRKQIKRTN